VLLELRAEPADERRVFHDVSDKHQGPSGGGPVLFEGLAEDLGQVVRLRQSHSRFYGTFAMKMGGGAER
jgi:hypothetical protein